VRFLEGFLLFFRDPFKEAANGGVLQINLFCTCQEA